LTTPLSLLSVVDVTTLPTDVFEHRGKV